MKVAVAHVTRGSSHLVTLGSSHLVTSRHIGLVTSRHISSHACVLTRHMGASDWITIRVTRDVAEALREESEKLGVSTNHLIKALLLQVHARADAQVNKLLAKAPSAVTVSGGEEFVGREDRSPAGKPRSAAEVRRERREFEHRDDPDGVALVNDDTPGE